MSVEGLQIATRRSLLGVLALLVALSACTTRNPVTGRPEVILMSEEQEEAIDREAAAQIEAELGLVRDEALTAYVDGIGQTLASHSPRPDVGYEFAIVEMDEPNAFALPGGRIYVSRGLLLLSNSEAELANVLAHEVGHVAARHAAQRDAHMKTLGIATLLGTIASGSSAGSGRSGPIGPGGIAAYSRDQEREADKIGQELVVDVGIDPRGMSSFLRSLNNYSRLMEGFSRPESYFSTHPRTGERIAEADTSAQLRRWEPGFAIAKDRDDYLSRIDGLSIGRPASEGVIRDQTLLHADLGFSLRFAQGWHIVNQSAQVIAISPARDGLQVLEIQQRGHDPQAAAEDYARKEGVRLHAATPLRVGELDAYRGRGRVETAAGPVDAEITWIAFDGNIYRLTAGARGGRFRAYEGIFRSFPRSFRPLRDEDRANIQELRLRLVRAEEGENLSTLSQRTGNEWDLNMLSVANAIGLDQRLQSGRLIKIAKSEPYVPEPDDVIEEGPEPDDVIEEGPEPDGIIDEVPEPDDAPR